jgi:hypothetical protein
MGKGKLSLCMSQRHTREWRYSTFHSWPLHYVELVSFMPQPLYPYKESQLWTEHRWNFLHVLLANMYDSNTRWTNAKVMWSSQPGWRTFPHLHTSPDWFWAHPASSLITICFSRGKVASVWQRPVTSIYHLGWECMELYFYSTSVPTQHIQDFTL